MRTSFLIFVLSSSLALADDLYLKSGFMFKNVQLVDTAKGTLFYRLNGKEASVALSTVLRVDFKPVGPDSKSQYVLFSKELNDAWRTGSSKSDSAISGELSRQLSQLIATRIETQPARKIPEKEVIQRDLTSSEVTVLNQSLRTQKLILYQLMKRDPAVAAFYTIVLPTLGHAYAGVWRRSLFPACVRIGGIVMALTVPFKETTDQYGITSLKFSPFFFIGLGASLIAEIVEIADAAQATREFNESLWNNVMNDAKLDVSFRNPSNHSQVVLVSFEIPI